jgi:hypothetical protein
VAVWAVCWLKCNLPRPKAAGSSCHSTCGPGTRQQQQAAAAECLAVKAAAPVA